MNPLMTNPFTFLLHGIEIARSDPTWRLYSRVTLKSDVLREVPDQRAARLQGYQLIFAKGRCANPTAFTTARVIPASTR